GAKGKFDVRYCAQVGADLHPRHPLVGAGELGAIPGGPGIQFGIEDRKRAADQERGEPGCDLVARLQREAVKSEILVPSEIGRGEEWVVEATEAEGQIGPGAVLDESAVEPDRVLAEVAASAAERLVERDR